MIKMVCNQRKFKLKMFTQNMLVLNNQLFAVDYQHLSHFNGFDTHKLALNTSCNYTYYLFHIIIELFNSLL